MINKPVFWSASNQLYAVIVFLAGLVWFLQVNTFGIVVGAAAMIISFFLFRQQRWAYFAAAVWSFGLLRIAMDDGNNFYQGYDAYVKLPYLIAVVVAIILHEKVAKK